MRMPMRRRITRRRRAQPPRPRREWVVLMSPTLSHNLFFLKRVVNIPAQHESSVFSTYSVLTPKYTRIRPHPLPLTPQAQFPGWREELEELERELESRKAAGEDLSFVRCVFPRFHPPVSPENRSRVAQYLPKALLACASSCGVRTQHRLPIRNYPP